MQFIMNKLLFLLITMISCSACWRMPQEGEVSTLPTTNNPNISPQKQPWMPQSVDY